MEMMVSQIVVEVFFIAITIDALVVIYTAVGSSRSDTVIMSVRLCPRFLVSI